MNPEPQLRAEIQSFFTFLALQLARIHTQLYPESTYPKHMRGPRKPDMAEQESQVGY
jgi:hypothetical protein